MKKTILTSLLLFFVLIGISAQENRINFQNRNNSVFLEAGGTAVWYSVNYERKFSLKPMHRITAGIGTSVIPTESYTMFSGLLSAGYLYGEKHNLELGIGLTYLFSDPEYVGSARIGYRYEAPKGFLFRIGFSPIYGKFAETGLEEYSGKGVLPWGYISVGYSF